MVYIFDFAFAEASFWPATVGHRHIVINYYFVYSEIIEISSILSINIVSSGFERSFIFHCMTIFPRAMIA